MDDATRRAWEDGPYGRCLALAAQDRADKRARAIHWSAANFIDDDTPDAKRVRPTETQAVARAFWSCSDAGAVRAILDSMGRDAAFDDVRPTFVAEWRAVVERGKGAALERQRERLRELTTRAVPLFDLSELTA